MADTTSKTNRPDNAIEKSGNSILGIFRFGTVLLGFVFLSMAMSVVLEWVGMSFIWDEQGSQHSQDMLNQEIGYLNEDFSRKIFGITPYEVVTSTLQNADYYLRAQDGWRKVIYEYGFNPVYRTDSVFVEYTKRISRFLAPYFDAAKNIILIAVVRLTIILLTLPLLILVCMEWLTDGLCERELRKEAGGPESSNKFHIFFTNISRFTYIPLIVYLAWPTAIHPNVVLFPMVLSVGIMIYYSASNYASHW